MLCWAFKANFTNFRRRTTQVSSFHDMRVEKPANERKCVTHVYAHCVTQVCAPCREGRKRTGRCGRGRLSDRGPSSPQPSAPTSSPQPSPPKEEREIEKEEREIESSAGGSDRMRLPRAGAAC